MSILKAEDNVQSRNIYISHIMLQCIYDQGAHEMKSHDVLGFLLGRKAGPWEENWIRITGREVPLETPCTYAMGKLAVFTIFSLL